MSDRDTILLLMPTTTYKSADFLEAAERLGLRLVVGSDRRQALESAAPGNTLTLPLGDLERGIATIVDFARSCPLRGILGTDDETTPLAAAAAARLGLTHNPLAAVQATRNKYELRRKLAAAGLRGPEFRRVRLDVSPERLAADLHYPCVVKPLSLSASRGVLRADDPQSFVAAFRWVVAILGEREARSRGNAEHLLVEDYLPGAEFAVEGLLEQGELRPLALFDKPDPLVGPTFEETLLITPSRLPQADQRAIIDEAARGCRALGLVDGPLHAELRWHDDLPWLLEVAPRTIGGLCARTLRFGTGLSLEELVLRHATGREHSESREERAAGVLMLPIPRAGVLRAVEGLDAARALPLVEEVTLTQHIGAEIVPLPEGHRYLGFAFARGQTPDAVEHALRAAHDLIAFQID